MTKKEGILVVCLIYGLFLIINIAAIAIAMIMATPVPRMYISTGDWATCGCGVGVSGASSTVK
jgi:hypothetical protein